ncbi:centrosome-associated protein 350-like [Mobula hypostoma]|uniref:centrosome-associated protein 350-like n=1 Tax=Mobula hypostoma TaxID=723540 RepID=UPI002FC3A555
MALEFLSCPDKFQLQQTESKLNSEEDEHLPESRVQKCLQFETQGCGVQNSSSISDEGNSPQRPASMNISRLGTQGSLSQGWNSSSSRSNSSGKVDYILENGGSSRRMFWNGSINSSYKHVTDHASQLSAVRRTMKTADQKSSDNPSTRVIPTRCEELAEWDVSEKGCYKAREQDDRNRSYKCYLEGEPPVGNGADLVFDNCSQGQMLQQRKSSPDPLVVGSSLSPPGSPLIQCLELKRSKSPTNKLERLKERIRMQRKLQKEQQFVKTDSGLPQEQSIPFLRQKTHKDDLEKCLVRKVTFAPPAPAYKGFNAVKLIPEVESCTGVEKSEGASAGNPPVSSRGRIRHRLYRHQEPDSRIPISIPGQRRKHQQNSSREHEATRKPQSCSKIISPKEPAKVNGSSSSDVFSWKQGQKLIRMLLGPTPKRQQSPVTTPDTNDSNSQYLSGEKVKYPKGRARSPSYERNPRRRLYVASEDDQCGNSTRTGTLDSSQPGLESMQVDGTLAGLQSGKTAGMNPSFTWKTGDDSANVEEKREDTQKNLATPKGDKHEDEHGGPRHWRTCSPKSCTTKRKPYSGVQRRPSPAGHRVGSSSPEQNKAKVENQEQRGRSPVARSYNADEVREYMSRQVAKRKRKESERKQSVKQAMEMKKRRLQEVYRKQKEAVSRQKKGRQKDTLPVQNSVEGYKSSAWPGKSLGSTQLTKNQTPTRDRPEPGDLEKSGSYRQELKNLMGSSCNSLPGQCNPLGVQDLDPLAYSPKLSSSSPITSRSLAAHEQQPNCSPAPCKGSQYRDRQQRLEALRSMATALSSRIENEARRLGMETGIVPGPGGRDSSQEWERGGLDGPVRPDTAAMLAHGNRPEWQGVPGGSLVTSPSLPTDFSLLPNSLLKELGRVEADRPKDKRAENQTDLEVKELVDELLRSPSSQSDDFLWSDSETWSDREVICSPRESSNGLLDEDKGLEDQSDDDLGTLSKGKHQPERKTSTDETAFDTPQLASGSLGKGGSWETGNMQDGNKPLIENSQRLSSPWSPSRTMPSSSLGDEESVTVKDCGITERSCYYLSSQSHRNPHSGKPFSDSKTAINPRKVTTNEMVKRKEDPVTQRLAELMKQLQEETEELRMKTPLKGDSVLEMKRSLMSPDSTEHLKSSRSRTGAEISVDGNGTAHTSVTHGSLMEQSLWSLLPSESHYRQTMERIKNLHSRDGSVLHTPSISFNKWEETGRPIFGNHDAFSRFTLEMAHQYLKEEDLRARHQAALFRLREKALKEKTRAELAWLEHQKTHLQDKGQDDKRPVIVRKQREVLLKLQKEKAEIRHLQNACQVAHQERKLLLKQQQEIFRIHRSTAHLQWQLGRSATCPWFSEEKETTSPPAADSESTRMISPLPDPDVGCSFPRPLPESDGSSVMERLKEMRRKPDERFLPKTEEEVFRQQKQAMSMLVWKHSSDTEEPVVHRTGTEALATWGPQIREQVPSIWGPSTETDNRNAVEYSSNPESSKHLEINKMMMLAADFSLDELTRGQQTVKPAETLKPICTVLEPSEKLMMKAGKVQSEKAFLLSEMGAESTAGETHTSPLRHELASRRVKLGSIQSEQRRRQREKLKMEEAELCRQLEAYDAFISKTQAELILDADVNQILKPQIMTPSAAQYKSQMDFPRPHRSNLLQHSAKQNAMTLQSQELPSKRDGKAKDVVKAIKPQETAGAEGLTSAGNSEFDEKSSHVPNAQLSPLSHPVERMQSEETHPGTFTLSVFREWSGHLDVTTDKSGPSPNSKEEVLQYNGPDSSAFNRTQSSNSLLSTNPSPKQNTTLSPSEEEESLFQRRLKLHSDDFWSNWSKARAADHSSQNTCEDFVNSNTELKADHRVEFDLNQSSTVVINAKGFKENGFGSHVFLANISGFTPSSNQQPALGLRANRLTNETGGQEGIAAESPPRRTANICEQASVLPLINSPCTLKEVADLAHSQQTAAGDSWTAEVISPASFLVFNDDFPSTDDKSEGMEKDLFCKREVQSSVKGTNEILPPLPQEENSLRSEAAEEVTSCSKDPASPAEGFASESVELPLLNAEGVLHWQQGLLPVLKSSSEMEVLAIPLIDTSAQMRRIPPVEEISFVTEELPSPTEGDNPLNTKEMSSSVDESMVHEADVSSSPTECTISFETEEFPPLAEEIIMLPSKELPSPSRANSIVQIKDFSPSSANIFPKYESSVHNKNNGVSTDEFTHPPPPVEKMVEERNSNVTEKYKYPLRSSRDKKNITEFCGNNLLLEPSRVLLPQTRQQTVEPLSCSTIRDQELIDIKKADSLKFKGHSSFGQDYWVAEELDKPTVQHDGAICELKYKECTKKCDVPITPEDLFQHWDIFDVNTDVTDSEDSFSEGSPILNQRDANDYLKRAQSSEAEFEMKMKEKVFASQEKDKNPILDQSDEAEAHRNSNNDLELQRIILECAKAVESFADSENLLGAEVEPKSHLENNLNSEGLVRSRAEQQLVGKGSEQSLNDAEGFLTQYLVEGTLGEVTGIRDQEYHSTQKKLSQCQIKRHSAELTQQNSQTLQRQRALDRSYEEMTGLLRVDLMQVKVRIAKNGSYKESMENVINYLITEFIDEATKEYKKIKRKRTGNTEAKLILYSQPAVECSTQLKMVHNAGISGNSPDIGNRKLKGLQPFLGTKTHGQRFLLDHWCSVPWRRSEETTFVVPHKFTEIQHWVGNSVNALWGQRGQLQDGNGINVLECRKDTDEMNADGKSKRVYKQAIFDLTSAIFQNALKKEPKNKLDPWMKARPRALFYSGHALNKEDKTEMTIQELQEEESHWIEYADDELALKMKLTEDIFNILLHDTADILSTICGKKLAEQKLISSST